VRATRRARSASRPRPPSISVRISRSSATPRRASCGGSPPRSRIAWRIGGRQRPHRRGADRGRPDRPAARSAHPALPAAEPSSPARHRRAARVRRRTPMSTRLPGLRRLTTVRFAVGGVITAAAVAAGVALVALPLPRTPPTPPSIAAHARDGIDSDVRRSRAGPGARCDPRRAAHRCRPGRADLRRAVEGDPDGCRDLHWLPPTSPAERADRAARGSRGRTARRHRRSDLGAGERGRSQRVRRVILRPARDGVVARRRLRGTGASIWSSSRIRASRPASRSPCTAPAAAPSPSRATRSSSPPARSGSSRSPPSRCARTTRCCA
jgi:hypothetical protein